MHLKIPIAGYDFISFLLMLIFFTFGVSYFTGIFLSLLYYTSGEKDKLNKAKSILLLSLVILLMLGLISYLTITVPALNKPPG